MACSFVVCISRFTDLGLDSDLDSDEEDLLEELGLVPIFPDV